MRNLFASIFVAVLCCSAADAQEEVAATTVEETTSVSINDEGTSAPVDQMIIADCGCSKGKGKGK